MTLHFTDQGGAASLRYRNRAEITVVMCEQKPYIRYGFVAGAKAVRCSVNIALGRVADWQQHTQSDRY